MFFLETNFYLSIYTYDNIYIALISFLMLLINLLFKILNGIINTITDIVLAIYYFTLVFCLFEFLYEMYPFLLLLSIIGLVYELCIRINNYININYTYPLHSYIYDFYLENIFRSNLFLLNLLSFLLKLVFLLTKLLLILIIIYLLILFPFWTVMISLFCTVFYNTYIWIEKHINYSIKEIIIMYKRTIISNIFSIILILIFLYFPIN